MKLLAMILGLPMAALAVMVEPLPTSEYADTEVSTNISFVVDRSMMTRIEFTVALDATPTNNVEVAIGTDGNGDGNLAVEESAYVFGYDCGKWFVRDQSKSKVEVEERNLSTYSTDQPERARCPFHAFPPSWNGHLARSAGQPEQESNHHSSTSTSNFDFSDSSNFDNASHTFILKKRKLDAAWDTVKVTRRGCGAACELVKAEGRKPGFKLEVR